LFSLGVVLHIVLCGKHPFSKTGGGVPAVAVCQAKQAVRTALKEAARVAKLGTMAEAVEECTLLGAEVFVSDDPAALSALESECGSDPQQDGQHSAAASAASSSSGATTGRASRWAPDLSGPEWTGISDEAKSLVAALMDPDPRERPTADQCLHHLWTETEASKQLRSIQKRSKPFVGDISALVDACQLQLPTPSSDTPQKPFALLAEDIFTFPSEAAPGASRRQASS
jgi:serine/threonine protein kinase